MYSVKAYAFCKDDLELIENFNECIQDKDTIWHCHHRLETHTEEGLINYRGAECPEGFRPGKVNAKKQVLLGLTGTQMGLIIFSAKNVLKDITEVEQSLKDFIYYKRYEL